MLIGWIYGYYDGLEDLSGGVLVGTHDKNGLDVACEIFVHVD